LTTNNRKAVKSELSSLHGKLFLPILIISILVLSCSSSDKKAIISQTEAVIAALRTADYQGIPELEKAMLDVDDESAKLIRQTLRNTNDWIIEVGEIEGFRASSAARSKTDGKNYSLIFNFTYDGEEWRLDDKVTLNSNVEFIPFIGRE